LPPFRRRHPDIDITWQVRSLHGFEFTPVDDLAREFDLIILDHPFCGAVARSKCLVALDDLLRPSSDDTAKLTMTGSHARRT
jgi:multiple sugar transport system substrate-binding protein